MSITRLHQTARQYAKSGFPVFPCHVGAKKPACLNGYKDATTDLKQIDKWWGEADYNIAICPEDCGWCVIDAESEAWQAFESKLPRTFTVATPRGGRHYYFAGSLASTVQKLGPKIDTRGVGGYVLIAPSVVDGKPYSTVRDVALAPVPAWVADALRPVKPVKEAPDIGQDSRHNIRRAISRLKRLAPVKEFEGSDAAAYTTACEMKDLGLSESKTLEVMLEHWQCDAKDEWWVAEKVHNAYHHGQNAPGVAAAPSAAEVFKDAKIIPGSKSRLVSRRADTITPKKLEWVWLNRFPRGKLSLLAGDGGLGKTTALLDMAARISQGVPWPDGEKTVRGDVLYFSAEDTPDDTLIPRLMAAGADLSRVHIIEAVRSVDDDGLKTFHLGEDLAELDKLLRELPKTQLVIFDPISSYLGKTDTYRNSEVRSVLEPVVRIASTYGISIIGNTHLSKNSKGHPTMRILDSVAFTATTRSIYMVTPDSEDKRRRLFVPSKYNNGPEVTGLAFSIASKFVTDDGIVGSHVVWDKAEVTQTADEAFAANDQAARKPSVVDSAAAWLRDYLKDGPKQSVEVYVAGESFGHNGSAIRRAVKHIGIQAEKADMNAGWIMRLP